MKNVLNQAIKLFLALAVTLSFTACGNNAKPEEPENPVPETADTEKNEQTQETEAPGEKVLVVYFSATGTTKGVAEKIASVTGGDLYEIVPVNKYSDDDLNWHDSKSRTTYEQNDKSARPEIAGEPVSLEGYTTVFVGFPIWWGEEPRIMDTFAESYNFDGLTVIPFCTSGSSGIGKSGQNLAELAKSGAWLDGKRLPSNVSEADLQTWIDGLKS
jgi:flavodoxin